MFHSDMQGLLHAGLGENGVQHEENKKKTAKK